MKTRNISLILFSISKKSLAHHQTNIVDLIEKFFFYFSDKSEPELEFPLIREYTIMRVGRHFPQYHHTVASSSVTAIT